MTTFWGAENTFMQRNYLELTYRSGKDNIFFYARTSFRVEMIQGGIIILVTSVRVTLTRY